jgi:hypothetical protein
VTHESEKERHMGFAEAALRTYADLCDDDYDISEKNILFGPGPVMSCLIADVRHLVDALGLDWDRIIKMADMHHDSEASSDPDGWLTAQDKMASAQATMARLSGKKTEVGTERGSDALRHLRVGTARSGVLGRRGQAGHRRHYLGRKTGHRSLRACGR